MKATTRRGTMMIGSLLLMGMAANMTWAGGSSSASFAICCSVCDNNYQTCYNNCGPNNPTCLGQCQIILDSCHRNCDPNC